MTLAQDCKQQLPGHKILHIAKDWTAQPCVKAKLTSTRAFILQLLTMVWNGASYCKYSKYQCFHCPQCRIEHNCVRSTYDNIYLLALSSSSVKHLQWWSSCWAFSTTVLCLPTVCGATSKWAGIGQTGDAKDQEWGSFSHHICWGSKHPQLAGSWRLPTFSSGTTAEICSWCEWQWVFNYCAS